jgi:hypothetical protein
LLNIGKHANPRIMFLEIAELLDICVKINRVGIVSNGNFSNFING